MTPPRYWMHETSGLLRPVVEDYLNGHELAPADLIRMRQYLRQWIGSDAWTLTDEIAALRVSVERIRTTGDVRAWVIRAGRAGIDPF